MIKLIFNSKKTQIQQSFHLSVIEKLLNKKTKHYEKNHAETAGYAGEMLKVVFSRDYHKCTFVFKYMFDFMHLLIKN